MNCLKCGRQLSGWICKCGFDNRAERIISPFPVAVYITKDMMKTDAATCVVRKDREIIQRNNDSLNFGSKQYTVEEFRNMLQGLSVLELNALLKACEEEIGPSSVSPLFPVDDYNDEEKRKKAKTDSQEAKNDIARIDAVSSKINAIGTVAFTEAVRRKIYDARYAYDKLTPSQRRRVKNYSVLTTAETQYRQQRQQRDVDVVIDQINAIGMVTFSYSVQARIHRARQGYNNLASQQKALVTNYSKLESAESQYRILTNRFLADVNDLHAADVVSSKINAIGTVVFTEAVGKRIDDAMSEYEKLTPSQRRLVKNYSVLATAETEFEKLETQELNKLIRACREGFGTPETSDFTQIPVNEDNSIFDVELTKTGPNKVKVIKVVREITGLGLKEAKDLVDNAPKLVRERASKTEADVLKAKLEAEGARATLYKI